MKILLLDVSHIFWTTWHGLGADSNMAAESTCQRVLAMRTGYDVSVACCDIGPSWRKKLYPEYKMNRPEKDPSSLEQLRRLREMLEADGLAVVFAEGYEADDCIASLAKMAPSRGYEVTIASGDKDLLQLVSPGIEVLSTNPGGKLMHEQDVRDKFNVKPSQIADYLALVGDTSDNVKGCPGVGKENASRLLGELGSLSNMYESLESVTPVRIREALIAHRDSILLGRKLVGLSYDVPLKWEEVVAPRVPKAKVHDGEFEDVPDSDDAPKRERPEAAASELRSASDTSGGAATRKDAGSGAVASGGSPVAEESYQVAGGVNPGSAQSRQVPPKGDTVTVAAPAASGASPRPEPDSSALVLDRQDPAWQLTLEPRGLNQLKWYAERLHESGMYRKFANPQAIEAAICRGRSLGLDMMTSLDVINVVQGKPTLGAMAIVGLVLASGKAEYFDCVEAELTYAIWETKRVGRPPKKRRFDIDEATARGLLKPSPRSGAPSQYVIQPRNMLQKQCAVELARLVYPDICANMYSSDEMGD